MEARDGVSLLNEEVGTTLFVRLCDEAFPSLDLVLRPRESEPRLPITQSRDWLGSQSGAKAMIVVLKHRRFRLVVCYSTMAEILSTMIIDERLPKRQSQGAS